MRVEAKLPSGDYDGARELVEWTGSIVVREEGRPAPLHIVKIDPIVGKLVP